MLENGQAPIETSPPTSGEALAEPASLLARQAAALTGAAAVLMVYDGWLVPTTMAPVERAGLPGPLTLADPALATLAPIQAARAGRAVTAAAVPGAAWSLLRQPHAAYPIVLGADLLGLLLAAGPTATDPALQPRLAELAALGAYALAAVRPTTQAQHRLTAFQDLTKALTTAPLQHVLASVAALLAVRGCLLQLPDETGHLIVRARYGLDLGEVPPVLIGEGDSGWVFLHTQPRFIQQHPPGAERDAFGLALTTAGVRAALAVPITAGARSLGVLTLCDPRPERAFSAADLPLAGSVSHLLALVVEQRRARFAGQEAQVRLAALLRAIPDGVMVVNPAREIVLANAVARHQFLLPNQPAPWSLRDLVTRLGLTRGDGAEASGDDLAIAQALRQGQPVAGDLHLYRDVDDLLVYACQALPLHDERGALIGVLGLSRDVSAERRQAAHAEALTRAAQAASRATTLADLATQTIEAAVALLGADTADLWLLEADGRALGRAATTDAPSAAATPARLTLDSPTLIAEAARTLTMQVTEEAATLADIVLAERVGEADRANARSVVVVPLVAADHLVGVLAVMARQARRFPLSDLHALQSLVGLFATACAARRLAETVAGQQHWIGTIIGELPEGVIVAEAATHRIIAANRAAERLLGRALGQDHHDLVGDLPFREADGARCPPERQPLLRALDHGETCLAVEARYDPPDAPPRVLLVNCAPLHGGQGTVQAAVAIFQDITERKAEQERRDGFLSIVAHELKTPLTNIRGYAELIQRRLARDGMAERHQRSLMVIGHQVDRVTRLINDLLDISRLEAGQFTIEPVLVDLADLIDRAVTRDQADLTHHRIIWNRPAATLLIRADPGRLERVIRHLLDNAMNYSPDGSTIRVELGVEAGEARLAVRDQGSGVPAEHQASLFERYRRPFRPASTGLGVGLHIAREIVTRHGGRLWIDSTAGQGSTFVVALPLDG